MHTEKGMYALGAALIGLGMSVLCMSPQQLSDD